MLVVFSHARSGSTFLMQRLRQFSVLRVYLELFHFDDRVIVEGLGADARQVLDRALFEQAAIGKGAVRQFVTAHVDAYLSALSALDRSTVAAFKVFPHHLEPPGLAAVMRHCTEAVLLTRNLLHAYVSWEIARSSGEFSDTDTSQTRVEFRPDAFADFAFDCVYHHDVASALAGRRGVPITLLRYEDLLASDDKDRFLAERIATLKTLETQPRREPEWKSRRQDTRGDARQKVSNPEALEAFLREWHLEALIHGDTPCDLDQIRSWLRMLLLPHMQI